mmetsp:Transcript_100191/g.138026  ORF Transcript_100191/g.138026 Transcript_100191/m.138026 type:complete len:510 (+) Transcript_100191:310-1839(+)
MCRTRASGDREASLPLAAVSKGLARGTLLCWGWKGLSLLHLGRLHLHRAVALVLLHLGLLVAVWLPDPAVQHLRGGIVHLLPAVEAAALAQRADRVREGVVQVVEEHLVPAVLAAEDQGHGVVQHGPGALRVGGQELVPGVGVGEVRDEHPRRGVAEAREAGDGQHEAPALAEGTAQGPGAQEPDAGPEAGNEQRVLGTAREPLLVELLVALASGARVGEVEVPLDGEEGASVVETEEVDQGQHRAREHQAEGVDREGVLLVPPGPLQQPILELLRVPAELALVQQVDRAGVVAVVLQHELLPGQREEVAEGVGDVALPLVGREGRAMHHIVVDVDVLNGDVREGQAEDQCAGPPVLGEEGQRDGVGAHHQALRHEDQRQDVPHVHHLLGGDLREQERKLGWHGVRLVGRREEAASDVAAVGIIFLHREHLVLALRDGSPVRVGLVRHEVLHARDLVVVLILLLELIEVLVGAVEHRGPRMLGLRAGAEQRLTSGHRCGCTRRAGRTLL